MTKAKFMMLAVFLAFFLANSYSWEVRALMWPIKFTVLGLFALYISYATRKKGRYLGRYTPKYVYFLLLLFGISGLYSLSSEVNIRHINFDISYGFMLLGGYLLVAIFSVQLSRFLSAEENQKVLYFSLIHSGAIVTFSNLLLYLLDINLGRGAGVIGGTGGVARFSGWLDNPNTLGVILLGTFPFALQAALIKSKKGGWVNYESLLVISMILLLSFTGSRAALLGMAVMGSMICWTHSYKARYFVILFCFFIGMLLLVEPNLTEQVMQYKQFQRQGDDILSGRMLAWEVALELIQKNPYFGYGMGAESKLMEVFMPITAMHQGKNFHNSYLSLLISSGIIGVIPLLILLVIGLKKSIGIFLRSGKISDHFAFMMSTLFLGFLVHAIFETWLFSPGSVYGFVFWVACFWLLSKQRRGRGIKEIGGYRLTL